MPGFAHRMPMPYGGGYPGYHPPPQYPGSYSHPGYYPGVWGGAAPGGYAHYPGMYGQPGVQAQWTTPDEGSKMFGERVEKGKSTGEQAA